MLEFWRLSWRVSYRHWSIYKKNFFSNISPTLADPLFFIITFGIGLGSLVSDVDGLPYIRYLAPGLAISTAFFTAFFETSYNFYVRFTYEHIYKAIVTTPIGVREILAGEFIWVAIKGAAMATGVTLVLLAFGLVDYRYVLLMPLVGALTALACGAIGFIATGLVKNINQFQTIFAFVFNPMFFFSGTFYPLESMPQWAQMLAKVSPLYHGVRLAQEVLWGRDVWTSLLVNGGALCAMMVVLAGIAVKLIYPKLYS